MTGTLLYEIQLPGKSDWTTLGTLTPGMPEGSITDMAEGGDRDILLFRCDGARSVVSRSVGGVDVEAGPVREVRSLGREVLAVLGDGKSYERDVTSDTLRRYRARWTHRNH